jgi:hypothetical protein
MQILLRRLLERLYAKDSIVRKWRVSRFEHFCGLVGVPAGAKIIDLGGTRYNWDLVENDYHVTIVNLPGINKKNEDTEKFHFVSADATDLSGLFRDKSFDIAFSNSVIEHVGDDKNVERFANEIRRLAKAYWVQTPSKKFPIEPHTGFPFFWYLPNSIREKLLDRWQKKLPAWTAMIRGTRLITEEHMRALFPDANVYYENKLGIFEKSYSFYKQYEK